MINTCIASIPVYILFAYQYSFSLTTLLYSIVLAILFSIAAIDLDQHIIPNNLVLVLLLIGFLNLALNMDNYKLLLGGLLFSFIFSLIMYVVSKGGIGGGDVKLLIALGLLLGFYNTYLLLIISFSFSALVGIVRFFLKRASIKSAMPFGPFITLGFVILSFV